MGASNLESLERIARELIASSEAAGDDRELAYGYYYLGSAYFWRSDGGRADDAYRKALDLFTTLKDRQGIAQIVMGQAAIASHIDLDTANARRLYESALSTIGANEFPKLRAATLGALGEVCQLEADYATAMRYANEAMAIFESLGLPSSAGVQLVNLAHLHTIRHEYPVALASLRRAYTYLAKDPNERRIAWYLDMCFIFAAATEQWETAVRLLGCANRYRSETNVSRLTLLPWFTAYIEKTAGQFEAQRFDALTVEGEELSVAAVDAIVRNMPD